MSTRTIYDAGETHIFKGNVVFEGSVTQSSNTEIITDFTGNVLVLNSDGNAVTTILSFNSNDSYANIFYDYNTPDRISFNRGIQSDLRLSASQTFTIDSGVTIAGNTLVGNVSGVASQATRLQNDRNFSISGDGIAPATGFNGTGDVNLVLTLSNSAVTAGAYGSATEIPTFTVDTKGRITSAANVTPSFIRNDIDDEFAGNISASNAAGPIIVNEAASFTNPTLIPNKADPDTGIGWNLANQLTLVAGGTGTAIITNTGVYAGNGTGPGFMNESASSTNPTLVPNRADLDTGWGWNTDELHGIINGTSRVTISATGITATNLSGTNTGDQIAGNGLTGNATLNVGAGDGISVSANQVSVDSTVIRTSGVSQTIEGNLNVNGNVDVAGNLNVQNVEDLNIEDTKITLNSNNTTTNENVSIIVNRPLSANVRILWNESETAWEFTNDGTTYYPMPTSTTDLLEGTNLYWTTARGNAAMDDYLVAGDGLTYTSGTFDVVAGDGLIANADNVTVDATVVRTTGDQSIGGVKTFTGDFVVPTTSSIVPNSIWSTGTDVYANVAGIARLLTGVNFGDVEDVGTGDVDIYAGSRLSANITIHGIKSISGATNIGVTESANVITITGQSNASILSLLSGTGLIGYDSGNGIISTTADNFSNWLVTTDTAGNVSISSGELLTFTAGTGIDVTHDAANAIITISTDADADISGVTAGAGLTGGGTSGTVNLDVGAGDGITVNADSIQVDSTVARTDVDETFTGNINVTDAQWNSASTVTSATTEISLHTFPVASYRSAEYLLQANTASDVHLTKVLVIHDGSFALATEYATIISNVALFTANVDVSSGACRLRITPASTASTTFKTSFTLVEV